MPDRTPTGGQAAHHGSAKTAAPARGRHYTGPAMIGPLAHITPLEAPIVWFAFLGGIAVGVLGTLAVLRSRASKPHA